MVHLEARYSYLEELRATPMVAARIDEILIDSPGGAVLSEGDANHVALELYRSVKRNDRPRAEYVFNTFSVRNPTRESHWIHDEFVIFAIVSAVRKFSFDHQWISNAINLTSYPTGSEAREIYSTFSNILLGNLNVKSDYHQISLLYQHLSGEKHFEDTRITKMFRSLWLKEFPFFDSTFLNIVSLKAIEVAFEVKGLLNPQELFASTKFVRRFVKRTNIVARIVSWVVVIAVASGSYFGLWKLNLANPSFFGFLTAASGVGIVAWFGAVKWLQKKLAYFIQVSLGFKVLPDTAGAVTSTSS